MSLCQDRQIKGFLLFLTLFALLFVGTATVLTIYQVNGAEALWLKHDEAVSSSLLEQGVPKEVIAVAFTNTDISEDGRSLLAAAGLGKQSESSMRPYFNQFQRSAFCTMLCTVLFFLFVLAVGIFVFFWKRKRLYQQADKILLNYINGDYSCHLPQNYEGAIYQVFSSVEQLATMLQSKNETERKAKEFLKDTISDISHQLKTPLAALAMYQEIIESEPENAETVKQFATKMGISLKRMEQLISSMLKITRLDTGNIIFEKKSCRMSELIAHSVNELTARAKNENKQIQIDGDGEQKLICDMEWTGEAIGNIVKNALDHTQVGGIVRITWNRAPAMFQIFISDNGSGIAPEDIHHIFKRFYRSKHSIDTQGIGLGLPLAKSIIEGQDGVISVQSESGKGTLFIFQSFQLVSELNVEQNIIFPLLLDYRKPDPAEVEEILDLLGLTERRHHLPNQLSGGQQQRVAIGRALITKPKLILADEPTGNLDSKNSQDVMALLTQASRRYQQTILMITHNKNLTASVDRVFRVSDGVLTDLGGKKNEALS